MDVRWIDHYRDSCHEQEGCTIHSVLVSTSENQTRVCADTNSYSTFNFAWGMLKTRVSTTSTLLDRRFGSMPFWGNNIGLFWGCFRAESLNHNREFSFEVLHAFILLHS